MEEALSGQSLEQYQDHRLSSEWLPFLQDPDPEALHASLGLRLSTTYEPSLANTESAKSDAPPILRYANRQLLSRYIPETDPDEKRAKTTRVRMAKRRTMLRMQLGLSAFVVATNIAVTVWALVAHPITQGVGTFFTGDCTLASRLNIGIHALLNVLSTTFLGAGNYCMQILVAPSTTEIEAAHSIEQSLDIGVHSIHNLRYISLKRKMSWAAIGLLSTSLHLVWNSAFFSSVASAIIPVAIVTEDFLTSGDDWNLTRPSAAMITVPDGPDVASLHDAAHNFTYANISQCVDLYINPLDPTQELVVVTNISSRETLNNTSLLAGFVTPDSASHWDRGALWMCLAYPSWHGYCTKEFMAKIEDDWVLNETTAMVSPSGFAKVQHCLVGKSAEQNMRCGFHYSGALLVIICCLTGCEAAIIAWLTFKPDDETVVLLGDAIAKFLKNAALASASAFVQPSLLRRRKRRRRRRAMIDIVEWVNARPSWFHAVGRRSWIISLSLLSGGVWLSLALLIYSLIQMGKRGMSINFGSIWSHGLGKANADSLIGGLLSANNLSSSNLIGHVLFVNMFQVLTSFLYLFYNNILTCQNAAAEMIRFMTEKKALRVSAPENLTQRSSYFLSLPWRYAVPQISAFVLLHWLISGSVFIVQTSAYGPGPEGKRIKRLDSSRIGFSTLGILLTTIVAAVLVIGLLVNSFRKYPGVPADLPPMAIGSAALQLLCRRPREDHDAYLYPLKLGIVSATREPADRLAFSSDISMSAPQAGVAYERPVWMPAFRLHKRSGSLKEGTLGA